MPLKMVKWVWQEVIGDLCGDTVNRRAHHAISVVMENASTDAEDQCNDTYTATHNVGHHIHDLFASGVIGEQTIP